MTDINDMIPSAEVVFHLPLVRNRHRHPDTIKRWAKDGLKGVKLRRIDVAGRWFVSLTDLEEFRRATGV